MKRLADKAEREARQDAIADDAARIGYAETARKWDCNRSLVGACVKLSRARGGNVVALRP